MSSTPAPYYAFRRKLGALSGIGPEPPVEYVAFVARHLDPLRLDAAGVVGEDGAPDELYTTVLTDVATWWAWLELARRRLHRADAADSYLRHAFARRSQAWHAARLRAEAESGVSIEIQVWRADRRPPPIWQSAALRLAPVVVRAPLRVVRPVAEAGVAWWHAYDGQRRRRRIAVLVMIAVVFLVIGRYAGAA